MKPRAGRWQGALLKGSRRLFSLNQRYENPDSIFQLQWGQILNMSEDFWRLPELWAQQALVMDHPGLRHCSTCTSQN